jgi:hypothetical protein
MVRAELWIQIFAPTSKDEDLGMIHPALEWMLSSLRRTRRAQGSEPKMENRTQESREQFRQRTSSPDAFIESSGNSLLAAPR